MEHQQQEEEDDAVTATETTTSTPPVAMKRSARMLHESSFATSSITASRGSLNSKRPPGFIASSLDYHQGGMMNSPNYSAASAASIEKNMPLTTKPVPDKNVIKERQEREQAEKERQYQQQRNYQNGNPTRAQGNFGPPPHKIKTLEDLEHMTEDQIYKLFMEDPELHASFMKAAENGNWDGKNPPTSAPVGARKARSSGTSGSSPTTGKSSRSSTKRPQKKKVEEVDKEVPYFQWLFILVVLAAMINQARKAYVSSIATTAKKGVTPHGKKVKGGGKPKSKKGAKATKKILPKKNIQPKRRSFSPLKNYKEKEVVVVAATDAVAVDTTTTSDTTNDTATTTTTTTELSLSERRSSGNKKKKVKSKQKSTPVADKDEKDQGRQEPPKPDLDSTNGSIADHEQEQKAYKTDIAVEMKLMSSSSPTADSPDEGEWQSVDKSKGGKKGKTVSPANVENNTDDSLDIKEDNVSTEKKTMVTKLDATTEDFKEPLAERTAHEKAPKTSKNKPKNNNKKTNNNNLSNVEKENTTNAHPTAKKTNGSAAIAKEDKKASEEESLEESNTKIVKEKSTVDDAALALQLHKEEVNLARAVTTNNKKDQQDEEDAWEEVANKKKKGINV
jgi:hypothetical protein